MAGKRPDQYQIDPSEGRSTDHKFNPEQRHGREGDRTRMRESDRARLDAGSQGQPFLPDVPSPSAEANRAMKANQGQLDPEEGAAGTVRTENPGHARSASGRTEVGDPDYRRDRPHVTENDQGSPLQRESPAPNEIAATPPNASGHDRVSDEDSGEPLDRESAYDRRPSQGSDNPPA
jgi:hypothetical protein